MRPRFSIRALLILVLVVSAACYIIFVRPTILANKFAETVAAKDFVQAESMFCDKANHTLTECIDDKRTYIVDVERSPTKLSDLLKLKRRMSVKLIPGSALPGSNDRIVYVIDVSATLRGIDPSDPYLITVRK